MKNTILISMLFYSIIFFAQNRKAKDIDSICGKFIDKLRIEKIDTISVYQTYSTGGAILLKNPGEEIDDCEYSIVPKTIYLFWKKNGKNFITKKNDCYDYATVEFSEKNIWETFYLNKEKIKSEKPDRFRISNEEFMVIDHSSYREFKFLTNKETVEQFFDLYDFLEKEEYKDNPEKNLSYNFNQSLKSKVVMDILQNLSMKYDSKVETTKQKRE